MKKASYLAVAAGIAVMLGVSGCSLGNPGKELVREVTPTPEPTATATPVPTATATPVPVSTATPTPWRIGTKTSLSSYVFLTNSVDDKIREVYLMAYGGYDWGKNLIPKESSIRASEQVQMCYTPFTADDGSTVTSYSMKFVTQSGRVYQLDEIPLQDMQRAVLNVENDEAVLHYTSLTDNSEKTITGSGADDTSSQEDSYDDDTDYSGEYYDDTDYSEQYYDDTYDSEQYYDSDDDYEYTYDYDDEDYGDYSDED